MIRMRLTSLSRFLLNARKLENQQDNFKPSEHFVLFFHTQNIVTKTLKLDWSCNDQILFLATKIGRNALGGNPIKPPDFI